MVFQELNYLVKYILLLLKYFQFFFFLLVGVKEVANLQNIDDYMMNLHSVINSNQDAALLQTVRDVVGRLEFNG